MHLNRSQTDAVVLLGRILLASLFLVSGTLKIVGFAGTLGYMQAVGLPATTLLLVLTIVVEVGGGLALAFGWKTRWAALVLAGFVLIATFVFHQFWSVPPEQVQNQLNHFLKNIAIIGGLLCVFAVGPGRYSVERD